MMPRRLSDRTVSLTLCVLVASSLACSMGSNSKGTYGFTAEELQAQKDKELLKRIDAAEASLVSVQGPKQYREYVLAVCDGLNRDVYARQPDRKPYSDDVVALGDSIALNAPHEAHLIGAYTGLFLSCDKNFEASERRLLASVAIKPSREAGELLAVLYGHQGQFQRVGEVCAEVVPALRSDEDRFLMIETCKEQMHSTSDEAALYWARPEDIVFWNAEQAHRAELVRRRQEAEEKERARLMAEQREQAQRYYEQRREAQQREAQAQKSSDICVSQCKQRAYQCTSNCYNDNCHFSCNEAYKACQEECFLRNDRPYTR